VPPQNGKARIRVVELPPNIMTLRKINRNLVTMCGISIDIIIKEKEPPPYDV
jgi:hypothetical protein